MLLLQIPEAEARRTEIEAAFNAAVSAGADRSSLDHEFSQLTTALQAFLIAAPELRGAVVIGYIRGYSDRDPNHYVGQARRLLGIGKMMAPGTVGLCDILQQCLDRFVDLRRQNPDASRHYFRAVSLLLNDTVGLADNAE